MKTPARFVLAAVLGLMLPIVAHAAGSKIHLSGGDGSSFEKAVIIKGATEETGVAAEYAYLDKHFPGYRRGEQSLQEHGGHSYDVLEIKTADGKKKTVYFDISDFFGKS